MKRVEVNMSNSYRGYIEEYADQRDITMPQAYKELIDIGITKCAIEFESPPIDEEKIEEITS